MASRASGSAERSSRATKRPRTDPSPASSSRLYAGTVRSTIAELREPRAAALGQAGHIDLAAGLDLARHHGAQRRAGLLGDDAGERRLDLRRAGGARDRDGALDVAAGGERHGLGGHGAVAHRDDGGAVRAAALAPVERLRTARIAQEAVAAPVVEVAEHHVGGARCPELGPGHGAVVGLVGPLLARQRRVDQQDVRAGGVRDAEAGDGRRAAVAGGERGSPDRDVVAQRMRLDGILREQVHVCRPLGALPHRARQVRVVIARGDQHRHAGLCEAVAQEGDRVLADVVMLVDVARDADRVDRMLPAMGEGARHGVAQLGAAAGGRGPRFGTVKHAIEVDVGDVQELHGRTPKCRYGVGWNPGVLTTT